MVRSIVSNLSRWSFAFMVMTLIALAPAVGHAQNTNDVAPGSAGLQGGAVPGETKGTLSDSELWRNIRGGAAGYVSIPDGNAAVLIQTPGANRGQPVFGNYISSGQLFMEFRNGPLFTYGAYGLAAIVVLLVAFFAIRGRIKIDHGPAGETIERFKLIERIGHWLVAVSFIVLAITGLNILYGKQVLLPVIGKDAFAFITMGGKYLHHGFAFAFMLGLVMIFVMWVRHNIPNLLDLKWAAMGGGILFKGQHPPAKKFNGGQKIIFWVTILGGASLALSGWSLLFPFEYPMFAKTFVALNTFGFALPTELSPVQEQQYAQLWHGIVSLVMIVVIVAHIYIGSIGMEGAFDAMGTGQVDLNWAKEHHSLWVEEVQQEAGRRAPAE